MKRIVLTGGGTAGHVTPHFALLPELQRKNWDIHYIGTKNGIERELIGETLPYYAISAGKLRRYFDWRNFSDPGRVLKGIFEAYRILKRLQPGIVFSKGGFVAVPVTMAAWLLAIPVILHESDLTMGLANRLSLPFARQICLTFADSAAQISSKKALITGTPIRREITEGSRRQGLSLCSFSPQEPTVLIMGGSLGSAALNEIVRANLRELTQQYQLIHLCGKGNFDETMENAKYCQFEYARAELPHLFAAADFIVSRAGANSLFEILALAKPNILIPLSREASRGDQILNAQSFARRNYSLVLFEKELSVTSLLGKLADLKANRAQFVRAMQDSEMGDGTSKVLQVIEKNYKRGAGF